MNLGKEASTMLGLPFSQVEAIALSLASLTAAVITIIADSLPFPGVVILSIVRHFVGNYLKKNRRLAFWGGVCLILACDTLARLTTRSYELSVSIILGVLGSAIPIWALWRGDVYD